MYKTTATWATTPESQEINSEISPKITQMAADGKTDGIPAISYQGEGNTPPMVVQRTWTTEEDAQEWKTFLAAATPDVPTSIVIAAV